ncbi:O-linked N-acetylglucosamine transferase, SPINDLY family protein [Coleofasciculus sp. G3-WIS-01]|uniref:O-linked N-acetylglucosamine transferase, SPINDLY family protein n=1 Tax=Coleofasciculus sp. G3-WIS-01 TaxID=3069528 RepID=UPI0040641580
MGDGLFQQGKWQAARECYEKILAVGLGDAELYWRLSECLRYLRLTDTAIRLLTQGIELYPEEGKLHFSLIMNLHARGRIQEAINRAKIASKLFPSNYRFKILKYLLLPIVYDNQAEIAGYRQEFIRGLQALIQETSLETYENQKNALVGIGSLTNFYLPYQAQNDRELQSQYGELVHKIMAANYPQWVVPVSMSPLQANDKIRIGYVSAYLHAYSGTLWLTGWLRYCDRTRFEVYCYYTGNTPDAVTQQFQEYSDVFYHSPGNLKDVCEQIIRDQLHILVFPEMGMDPQIRQMGGLRLAPVQCVAWGHPVTTGLPTIDYFLSSELMEPEKAQDHYSETLIRLPNIGVAYPKPYIPPRVKSRSDFQLREDAVIYLCCQAPFKYLPQYDWILAEIASRVPQAQFLFLRGDLLKRRLNRAFAKVGLRSEEYCVFRAIPERLDYLMINLLSDVYLDTFCWSGGNTTLEAIACCLPIVTCPGEFMRGRHSYSFLKMLGVTQTIAKNEVDYVEIAVKLGVDSAWRREIGERMAQRLDYLYEDRACVAGLEAFYQQIAIP